MRHTLAMLCLLGMNLCGTAHGHCQLVQKVQPNQDLFPDWLSPTSSCPFLQSLGGSYIIVMPYVFVVHVQFNFCISCCLQSFDHVQINGHCQDLDACMQSSFELGGKVHNTNPLRLFFVWSQAACLLHLYLICTSMLQRNGLSLGIPLINIEINVMIWGYSEQKQCLYIFMLYWASCIILLALWYS